MRKLLMALALMPLMALADMVTVIDDIKWVYAVREGGAEVLSAAEIYLGSEYTPSGALTIPSVLGGVIVTTSGIVCFLAATI